MAQRKAAGKLSIIEIKRRLQIKLREIDKVAVLDDNFLALVLPLTEVEGAAVVIKKFQEWVAEKGWCFGPAVYPEDGEETKKLLGCAQGRPCKKIG